MFIACVRVLSVLSLNNISLNVLIILFNHPSVDRYLGYFYFLDILNSNAMNMDV